MMFSLEYGSDLTEGIVSFCKSKKIVSGSVFFVGAVQNAVIGYYSQSGKKYKKIAVNKKMEIVSGIGNISMKEGRLFLHAHVALADSKGRVIGGHLFSPPPVFACEVTVSPDGPARTRQFDKKTGLFLWKKP
jgi:hypothetical protein